MNLKLMKLRQFAMVALTAAFALGAQAETFTNVKYVDADGTVKVCPEATRVTKDTAELSGWCVVSGYVSRASCITVSGAAHLILMDYASLMVEGTGTPGIQVSGAGNSLAIYGQACGSGRLNLTGGNYCAALGGEDDTANGPITINGGEVEARGGNYGAGIGGGNWALGQDITINGGKVTAKGGSAGASGIGSGYLGAAASNIKVNPVLTLKADGNNPPTTEIATDRTKAQDVASDLAGQQYATAAIDYTLVLKDGAAYKSVDGGTNVVGQALTFNGLAYDTAAKTWTMKDFILNTAATTALCIQDSATIVIDGANNTIEGGSGYGSGVEESGTCGILLMGTTKGETYSVKFRGRTGKDADRLLVEAGSSGGENSVYGLFGENFDVTVESVTLEADGSESGDAGVAVYLDNQTTDTDLNLRVENAKLIAHGMCPGGMSESTGIRLLGTRMGLIVGDGAELDLYGYGDGFGDAILGLRTDCGADRISVSGSGRIDCWTEVDDEQDNYPIIAGLLMQVGQTSGSPLNAVVQDNNGNDLTFEYYNGEAREEKPGKAPKVATIAGWTYGQKVGDVFVPATNVVITAKAEPTPPPGPTAIDYTIYLHEGKAYKNSKTGADITADVAALGLSYAEGVWTMNNFNFATTARFGVKMGADTKDYQTNPTKVTIKLVGANSVQSGDTTEDLSCGVYISGDLTLVGTDAATDSLTVTSGVCSNRFGGESVALEAVNVAVLNATVNANAAAADFLSIGIALPSDGEGTLAVTNATLVATSAQALFSEGVRTYGNVGKVSIGEGGTARLTANGGSGNSSFAFVSSATEHEFQAYDAQTQAELPSAMPFAEEIGYVLTNSDGTYATDVILTAKGAPVPPPPTPSSSTVCFAATEKSVAVGGEPIDIEIVGGALDRPTQVTVSLQKNTVGSYKATDKATGKRVSFPLTLNWDAGDTASKVITLVPGKLRSADDVQFLTLQLGSEVGQTLVAPQVCTVTVGDSAKVGALYVRALAWPANGGKVSGYGKLKADKQGAIKTVRTLRAKANSWAEFTGWYAAKADNPNEIDTNALITVEKNFKVGRGTVYTNGTFYAYFTDALDVSGVNLPNATAEGATGVTGDGSRTYTGTVGVRLVLPLSSDDANARITVSDLPAGLKYNKATGCIEGVPSRATSKTVRIVAKNTAGKHTATFDFVIDAMPAEAIGTWNGVVRQLADPEDGTHAGFGTVVFTVGKTGSLSARVTTRQTGIKRFTAKGYDFIDENTLGVEMKTAAGEVFSATLSLTNGWKAAQLIGTVTGGSFAENGEEVKFAAIRNAFDKADGNADALNLLESYKGDYGARLVSADGATAIGTVEFRVMDGGKIRLRVETADGLYVSTCAGAFRALPDTGLWPAGSAAVQTAIRSGARLWAMDAVLGSDGRVEGLACAYSAAGADTHARITE